MRTIRSVLEKVTENGGLWSPQLFHSLPVCWVQHLLLSNIIPRCCVPISSLVIPNDMNLSSDVLLRNDTTAIDKKHNEMVNWVRRKYKFMHDPEGNPISLFRPLIQIFARCACNRKNGVRFFVFQKTNIVLNILPFIFRGDIRFEVLGLYNTMPGIQLEELAAHVSGKNTQKLIDDQETDNGAMNTNRTWNRSCSY